MDGSCARSERVHDNHEVDIGSSYICTDVRGRGFRGYAGRAWPSGHHGAV